MKRNANLEHILGRVAYVALIGCMFLGLAIVLMAVGGPSRKHYMPPVENKIPIGTAIYGAILILVPLAILAIHEYVKTRR